MNPGNPGNPGSPTAGGIADILKREQLQNLVDAYDDTTMTQALSAALPALYPPAREYVDALAHAFYAPPTYPPSPLTAANRERCLLGILASRGANRNLAIHIYMALMAGIPAAEIGHILLLTGAYSGVESLAHGLTIAKTTLEILARLANDSVRPTPIVVLTELAKQILM